MIEKKTTSEIIEIGKDLQVKANRFKTTEKRWKELAEEIKSHYHKVWISEDSLRQSLLDMYRLMCNKYGKANIWNMNADELLENVDLLINEQLEKVQEK